MVMDEELTTDQIISKQLAHNAISGEDDQQVLKELWNDIKDVDQKIRSGIRDNDFDNIKFRGVKMDDVALDFEFKTVKLVFLYSGMEKFDNVLKELEDCDRAYLADKKDFDKFAKTLRDLSKLEDIRNIASLMGRFCDIVKDHIKVRKEEEKANPQPKKDGKAKRNDPRAGITPNIDNI